MDKVVESIRAVKGPVGPGSQERVARPPARKGQGPPGRPPGQEM